MQITLADAVRPSNRARTTDVALRMSLYCDCTGLATAWSPIHGVLRFVLVRIQKTSSADLSNTQIEPYTHKKEGCKRLRNNQEIYKQCNDSVVLVPSWPLTSANGDVGVGQGQWPRRLTGDSLMRFQGRLRRNAWSVQVTCPISTKIGICRQIWLKLQKYKISWKSVWRKPSWYTCTGGQTRVAGAFLNFHCERATVRQTIRGTASVYADPSCSS
jgi:hypothetical protein